MLIIYFIFVHLSLLLPGYALVCHTKLLKDHPGIELLVSYVLSISVFALLAVSGYAFDPPQIVLQVANWVLLLTGCAWFIRKKLYFRLYQQRYPLLAFVVMSLFSIAFIGLSWSGSRPFYPDPEFQKQNNYSVFTVKVLNVAQTNANDNYIPYRQAQFIINNSDPANDSFIGEWGVHFFQRTPLLGAVTAEYFTLFNDKPPIAYTWSQAGQDPDGTFMKFQAIAHILNTLFILPAFYILVRLFDRRTAKATLPFIVTSQFFLFNTFFSWPKSLVAFFILLSWLLLLEHRLRYLLLAGVVSGLAYLSHDLAVLYVGASVLLLLYFKRYRDIALFTALFILCALPWFIISALIYKKPSTFIYYPLSLEGIPQIEQKHAIVEKFKNTSLPRIIAIKLESLFYLLSPYQLIYSEGGQPIGRRLWALGLFSTPGAIGVGLVFGTVAGAVRQVRNLPFWILSLVPIILCTVIIGWPKGLGALHFAQASVVLLMGLGVWFLLTLKSKWWLIAAYVAGIVQLIIFTIYSYNYRVAPWLNNIQDVVLLSVLTAIIGLSGFLLFRVASSRTES